MNHKHVIKLVGTYTHCQFLGLLLWPVAVCDLAAFFEDVEFLKQRLSDLKMEKMDLDDDSSKEHIIALLPEPFRTSDAGTKSLTDTGFVINLYHSAVDRLYRFLGCTASALTYLHGERIRHKDLKPSNILLSSESLWITDFGASTDFSLLSTSATDGGERGSPKYFAPEVAAYQSNGRSADIFTLGCIFLEILTLCAGSSLSELALLRQSRDRSFQANLGRIEDWCMPLRRSASVRVRHLLCEIKQMLDANPSARPTAAKLESHIVLIDHMKDTEETIGSTLFGSCCTPSLVESADNNAEEIDRLKAEVIVLKNLLQARSEFFALNPVTGPRYISAFNASTLRTRGGTHLCVPANWQTNTSFGKI